MDKEDLFKPYIQDDLALLPPCIGDFISPSDPVRLVSTIVDKLDISNILKDYKGGGTTSYHPRMLLKVIIYAYLCNIYSGRKIEKMLCENIKFMWLSGMSRPDYRTINLFRSKRLANGIFEDLFSQVVELLNSEGLVSLQVQYIDGTKIESAANKYTFVWRGSVEKNKQKLLNKVHFILVQANDLLSQELQEEIPDELSPELMKEKTERIIKKLDSSDLDKDNLKKKIKELKEIKEEKANKLEDYNKHLEILGQRNSYSKTDPDATFMRMKEDAMLNGQTKPGYNVQISTENQFITHFGIYWRPSDTGTMIDYLESFKNTYEKQSPVVVADSGYGSEQNYEYMFSNGITPYVKYNMFHAESKQKYKQRIFLSANFKYDKESDSFICPNNKRLSKFETGTIISELGFQSEVIRYKAEDCSQCPYRHECYKGKSNSRIIEVNQKLKEYKNKARQLLESEEGLMHRSRRPIEPEAVFGDIKYNHGFKRFRLRSKAKVIIEFGLVALAHNIRKWANIRNEMNAVIS